MPKSTVSQSTRSRRQPAPAASSHKPAWSAGSAHLLLVTGSAEREAEFSATLAAQGYTVQTVDSGQKAVRRARYIYYQVIVLVLPVDGLPVRKVLADLHEASPESEILVVADTAFVHERIDRALLSGLTYLATPYQPEQLLTAVAQAVERQRQRRRLTALSEVAYAVGQLMDLPRVLEVGLDKTLEVLGRAMGAVYLLDEGHAWLELQCARGLPPEFVDATRHVDLLGDVHEQALSGMQPIYLVDLRQQADSRFSQRLQAAGARSAIVVPLRMRDQGLGTLVVAGRTLRAFSKDDVRLLSSIGQHLGVAVAHGRLHERERLAREQLTTLLLTLQQQAAELRSLSGRVVRAQEAERQHIARELHDGVGQVLTALRIDLGLVADMLPADPKTAGERLNEAREHMGELMNDVRRISAELRPSMLDDLGLVPTLNWLTEGTARRLGVPVSFEAVGWPDRADPDVEIGLFRIVQEAINNAVKHAGAHRIAVQLVAKNDVALLNIEDDGAGFDVDSMLRGPEGTHGSGLRGMHERVVQLSGEFKIESEPGRGTRLQARIPLGRPEAEEA